jgi:hypothetical protein
MNIDNLLSGIESIESGYISSPKKYSDDVCAFFLTANVSNYKSNERFKILGRVYYRENDDSFIHSNSIIMSYINNTLQEDLIYADSKEATHTIRLISQDKLDKDDHPFISEPESQIVLYDIDDGISGDISRLVNNPR